MAEAQWIRLNREQADRVLKHISTRPEGAMFSEETTDVSWHQLPFYDNYRLYRLTNYGTMPTITMKYLTNGEDFIALDGMATPIYVANERDPIKLAEFNVIPYLEFFFNHVQGTEGDVFIIKDIKKMPFIHTMSSDQQESVLKVFKPFHANRENDGSFTVSGMLYYGGGLINAAIIVTPDGNLTFKQHDLIMSGIYFSDVPYSQQWLDAPL